MNKATTEEEQRKKDVERLHALEYGAIPSLLFKYALPAVIGTVVNALYNVVDRIFIGQAAGDLAIAGLGVTFPILLFLIAFGMLIGSGASVRVSILMGRKELHKAEQILGNALILTFVFNVVLCTLALIFLEPLLRLFGAGDAIIPYAKTYLYIVIPFNLFSDLSFSFNAVMRASGYPTKAMISMLIGALTNVVLDAIFIFVFDWGIAGAAWATSIAMVIAACYVMSQFLDKRSIVHFTKNGMKPSRHMIGQIISIGVAPFAMAIVGAVVSMVINRSFAQYGTTESEVVSAMAAYAIILGITQLFIQFMLGVSMGMQPIVGFNLGAGKIERSIKAYKCALLVNVSVAVLGLLIALLKPSIFVDIFNPGPELAHLTYTAIGIVLLGFPLVGCQLTSVQFFQGLGHSGKAMFISVTRQLIYLLPGLLILPVFYGIKGVWIAMPLSDALSGLTAIGMILFFIPRFRRRYGKKEPSDQPPHTTETK